ncbi:MAG: pyridoxal 5'-phosphate synthase glutaminase subunit PdxT [Saccharofermentanales bacterium]
MKIGILAVQGAFAEHEQMLDLVGGVDHFQIRQKKDLEQSFDGLILPGGESTVMGKLLKELGLFEPLDFLIKKGLPVFGTCAGLILLAQKTSNDSHVYFKSMSLTVKRNAYGRQLGSFRTDEEFLGIGTIPMVFIRAPYIEKVFDNITILSTVGGHVVAARQGNQLVTAFHPELTNDTSVHQYFIEIVKQYNKN